MSDDVRKLLSEMRVPAALIDRLNAGEVPETIEPGQVWRARWDDQAALVLLTAVTAQVVTAAAVTLVEQPPTDSQVPVLRWESEQLPGATVWPGTLTELPLRVLERLLERSEDTLRLAVVVERARGVEVDAFDEGLIVQARLTDELLDLADVPELPVLDESTSTLKEELGGDAKAGLELLVELLDVPQAAALALYRGKQQLSPEQTTALVAAGVLTQAPDLAFPSDVVIELGQPFFKAIVLAKAAERSWGEYETRCSAAKEAHALAARVTADGDSVRARLLQALGSL